jgi:hypothetical protein
VRLVDLDPRWLLDGGRRVGFVFRCPLWDRDPKYQWWQTCFFEAGRKHMCCDRPECREADSWDCPHSQMGLAKEAGVPTDNVQGCKPACAWQVIGPNGQPMPPDLASFETLSVTPSLDGSAGGLWHGYVTNGEIVGGI